MKSVHIKAFIQIYITNSNAVILQGVTAQRTRGPILILSPFYTPSASSIEFTDLQLSNHGTCRDGLTNRETAVDRILIRHHSEDLTPRVIPIQHPQYLQPSSLLISNSLLLEAQEPGGGASRR
jgi:hypothetical protein